MAEERLKYEGSKKNRKKKGGTPRRRFRQAAFGQATVEYVLLIAVLAGIILSLGSAFQKRIQKLFQGQIGNYVSNQFFNPTALHVFPFNIPQ